MSVTCAIIIGFGLLCLGAGVALFGWFVRQGMDVASFHVLSCADTLAQARSYEARVRAGLVHKKEPVPVPPSEDDKRFQTWLRGEGFGEIEEGHVIGLWEKLTGKRPTTELDRVEAAKALSAYSAPLPESTPDLLTRDA